MAVAATEFEVEDSVEERIVRLEEKVDRVQSDVADLKIDVRRLDAKIDGVKDSVSELRVEMRDLVGELRVEVKDLVGDLRVEMKDLVGAVNVGRFRDKLWWMGIAAGLLSVMAHGFKWI